MSKIANKQMICEVDVYKRQCKTSGYVILQPPIFGKETVKGEQL